MFGHLENHTGEYTAERLAALRDSTAKLPSKYKPAAAAGTQDGSFKLSGSFKALKKANDDRFTYNYNIHGTVSAPGDNTAAAANGSAAATAGLASLGLEQQQQPEQMPLPPPPKRPGAAATAGPAAAAAGGGGSRSGSDEDEAGYGLPDEETIR